MPMSDKTKRELGIKRDNLPNVPYEHRLIAAADLMRQGFFRELQDTPLPENVSQVTRDLQAILMTMTQDAGVDGVAKRLAEDVADAAVYVTRANLDRDQELFQMLGKLDIFLRAQGHVVVEGGAMSQDAADVSRAFILFSLGAILGNPHTRDQFRMPAPTELHTLPRIEQYLNTPAPAPTSTPTGETLN